MRLCKMVRFGAEVWEPAAPYTGLPGPPGPKCQTSLEIVSRGLLPRDPKKNPQRPQNTPETLSRHFPETRRRLAGLSLRHFRDFFGISGPEGRGSRETSVRGGLVPKQCTFLCIFSDQNGLQKGTSLHRIVQKRAKKQYPSLVRIPFRVSQPIKKLRRAKSPIANR